MWLFFCVLLLKLLQNYQLFQTIANLNQLLTFLYKDIQLHMLFVHYQCIITIITLIVAMCVILRTVKFYNITINDIIINN